MSLKILVQPQRLRALGYKYILWILIMNVTYVNVFYFVINLRLYEGLKWLQVLVKRGCNILCTITCINLTLHLNRMTNLYVIWHMLTRTIGHNFMISLRMYTSCTWWTLWWWVHLVWVRCHSSLKELEARGGDRCILSGKVSF
jgi:hypothetical protein